MKKGIALLATLTMVAGTLTACGSSASTTQTEGTAASAENTSETTNISTDTEGTEVASANGRTEITFWHYMSEDKEGKYVNAAVEEFNSIQDEIFVTSQYLPRAELMKQYTIGVVSGELPD